MNAEQVADWLIADNKRFAKEQTEMRLLGDMVLFLKGLAENSVDISDQKR